MPVILVIGALIIAVGVGTLVFTNRQSAIAPEPEVIRLEEVEEIVIPEPELEDESNNQTGISPEPTTTPTETTSEIDEVRSLSAEGNYLTPARTAHIVALTLTLSGDTVTDAVVLFDGNASAGQYSNDNQARFDAAYKEQVIGKRLGDISLSRVGGASLTSRAFNEAVAQISQNAS